MKLLPVPAKASSKSRSALFHMKTKVCRKYFVHGYRTLLSTSFAEIGFENEPFENSCTFIDVTDMHQRLKANHKTQHSTTATYDY